MRTPCPLIYRSPSLVHLLLSRVMSPGYSCINDSTHSCPAFPWHCWTFIPTYLELTPPFAQLPHRFFLLPYSTFSITWYLPYYPNFSSNVLSSLSLVTHRKEGKGCERWTVGGAAQGSRATRLTTSLVAVVSCYCCDSLWMASNISANFRPICGSTWSPLIDGLALIFIRGRVNVPRRTVNGYWWTQRGVCSAADARLCNMRD